MTLEERCALLQGDTTFGTWRSERLGIPAMEFSDGPNGLRHQMDAADHLGIAGSEPATCFPTAVTVAQTWDEALGERIGKALGEEAAAQDVAALPQAPCGQQPGDAPPGVKPGGRRAHAA